MIPLLMLPAVLATLTSVAAGDVHRPSNEEVVAAEYLRLRGGRKVQGRFCDSLGCPAGYTSIADANFVECVGMCQVARCCKEFCWNHECPDGYDSIHDAVTTLCRGDQGCTTAMCCVNAIKSSTTESSSDDYLVPGIWQGVAASAAEAGSNPKTYRVIRGDEYYDAEKGGYYKAPFSSGSTASLAKQRP